MIHAVCLNACIATSVLLGQQTSRKDDFATQAKQLLESSSLSDRAWGVRLVEGLRLSGFEDVLRAELRASQGYRDARRDGPEYAYIQTLLGALIDLRIEVAPEIILPYRSRWGTEVVILLSRGKGNEAALLDMRGEDTPDPQWRAATNLLAWRRWPGLFEEMLEGVPVVHEFTVVDQGEHYGIPGGYGVPAWSSPPRRSFPTGFPSIWLYSLYTTTSNCVYLVADGPRRVCYERTLVPADGSAEWRDSTWIPDRTERIDRKLEYLAFLAQRTLKWMQQTFRPRTTIEWRNNPELIREVEKRLDEQVYDLRQFIIAAKLRGELGSSQVHLEVKPTLEDLRDKPSGLLAPPKPREIRLELP